MFMNRTSCMNASPFDLVSGMEAIKHHWHKEQWLRLTDQPTEPEWYEHKAITMSALSLLGIDGWTRLGKRCGLEKSLEQT